MVAIATARTPPVHPASPQKIDGEDAAGTSRFATREITTAGTPPVHPGTVGGNHSPQRRDAVATVGGEAWRRRGRRRYIRKPTAGTPPVHPAPPLNSGAVTPSLFFACDVLLHLGREGLDSRNDCPFAVGHGDGCFDLFSYEDFTERGVETDDLLFRLEVKDA